MTPSFEKVEEVILSIKDGSFNGDIMSFLCFEVLVMEEASKISKLYPNKAHGYLAEGMNVLNNIIFSLREYRYGIEKRTGHQLELVEVGLLNIYEHYLNLLAEVES